MSDEMKFERDRIGSFESGSPPGTADMGFSGSFGAFNPDPTDDDVRKLEARLETMIESSRGF